ncbi:MAG TPA: DNA polymerase domain-containing protein [Thermoplasmata archaeon]|nr:DNA polymerase domain-containing protein [Thermoplasmata archaeon]
MPALDLFLLAGSYRAVEDGVVLELYGRTREGESVVARYYGFRPYFVLSKPTEDDRKRLKEDPQVKEVTELETWVAGGTRPAIKVTVTNPWTVPEYRERYRKSGDDASVLACDIPFVHRFLYDKGLGLTIHFEAEDEAEAVRDLYSVQRVVRVVHDAERDILPASAFRPRLTVLSFDIENAIKERTIFTICGVVTRGGERVAAFRLTDPSEAAILDGFAKEVQKHDPDVITGYNIGGYDLPLVKERAEALGIEPLSLGRDRGPAREMGDRLWRVSGRVVADAWWSARLALRPKQESLDFVAQLLLGERKLDVDRRNIDQEWRQDPARVMEYCEKDAELAGKILARLRAMERAADMATVAALPLEEGLNGRTSQFIDAILIPKVDRAHIGSASVGVLPSRRAGGGSPIEGGYVHAIKAGRSEWVVVLDFKSMYPSIIIARNICFTTLSPEGTNVAPSGARFLSADQRRGLIPQILEELLAQRERFREASRRAETPELREYYDGLQNAVKVLMNSFYGVLASSFYRFTDKEIGAAITAFAREAITTIIRALEADGLEVVYSDTDSVFVRSPEPGLERARAFGEQVAKRFTTGGATFEFQSVYAALFSHGAKKRYVGRSVWPRDELVIRGYENRRSDAFDFQSESLLEVFELVLGGDTEAAVRRARELVKECADGRVPVAKLVIARSVRPEEQYNEATRENLPFLRVFRQLKEEGYDVIPGMKVAWIVTDAKKRPQAIAPWIAGRPFDARPDFAYYADRVAQTLARVTEVFDWDAESLLKGSHMKRFGGVEENTAPADEGEAVTLETPVTEVAQPRTRKSRQKSLIDSP